MKKLAIILALLLIPSFAFALDTISDSDMNAVTGQAGVSILINSVTIVKSGAKSGYGDTDNFTPGQINWVNIVQQSSATTKIGFHGAEPLTIDIIDVDTVVAAAGLNAAHLGHVGVEIQLPDMIQIEATPQLDGIYLNNVAGSDTAGLLIYRYTGGGTTKVIGNLLDNRYGGGTNYQAGTGANSQTAIIITNH